MGKLDAVSHILMKKDEQNHPLIKISKILRRHIYALDVIV